MVSFESLSTVSYSPSIVTMAVPLAVSENGLTVKSGFGVVQGHLKWRGLIDHIRLSVGPTLQIYLYLVTFLSYLTLNNIVTLKSGLEVTQDNSNCYNSKAWMRFPIRLP